jgi:hypothetical protein
VHDEFAITSSFTARQDHKSRIDFCRHFIQRQHIRKNCLAQYQRSQPAHHRGRKHQPRGAVRRYAHLREGGLWGDLALSLSNGGRRQIDGRTDGRTDGFMGFACSSSCTWADDCDDLTGKTFALCMKEDDHDNMRYPICDYLQLSCSTFLLLLGHSFESNIFVNLFLISLSQNPISPPQPPALPPNVRRVPQAKRCQANPRSRPRKKSAAVTFHALPRVGSSTQIRFQKGRSALHRRSPYLLH